MTTEQMDWVDDERAGRHCRVCEGTHNPGAPCIDPPRRGTIPLSESHAWNADGGMPVCSRCYVNPLEHPAACGAPCPLAPQERTGRPQTLQEAGEDLSAAFRTLRDALEPALVVALRATARAVQALDRALKRGTR